MKHPFAKQQPIAQEQLNQVNAAGLGFANHSHVEAKVIKSTLRPPVNSTMAIGEEGGSVDDIM